MSAALDALRPVLDEAELLAHEPLALEGAKLEATLRPHDGEALAAALALCERERAGLLVRGGGSKLSCANAPCRAQLLLDTTALRTPLEIDREEGVAQLGAGLALTAVADALHGSGWELPFESPDPAATIGGTIAAAALAPRFGPPRNFVLGLHAALSSGERVKFGGRVVKNVTGYDLNKLFTGSFGSLGVIESAWVRLRPTPEVVRHASLDVSGAPRASEAEAFLDACRRPSVRAGVELRSGRARVQRFELAGDVLAVEADARVLARMGAELAEPSASDRSAEALAGPGFWTAPFRFRLSARPAAWCEVADLLEARGVQVLSMPARGLLYGAVALDPAGGEPEIGELWQTARLAAEEGGGNFVIEAAPVSAREGREVFGDPGETIPLQHAIKRRFDGAGILNPGRFVGGA